MNSFRFNFSSVTVDDKTNDTDKNINPEITWLPCEEIKVTTQVQELEKIAERSMMFLRGDLEIGHVIPSLVIANLGDQTNELQIAEHQHSDLIAGSYEGGLKVWECTEDLIEYLVENKDSLVLDKAAVLDLGCGAGLLGIYAFLQGGTVTFQDYNKEVLERVTIPNILLNIDEEESMKEQVEKCKFYSGDWASFNKTLPEDQKFDLIFTSETIYNCDNHCKIMDVISKRLSVKGTVYVAAKTYYFGVGGGTRQFEKSLEQSNLFTCEVCWKSNGGIQREILKIKRK